MNAPLDASPVPHTVEPAAAGSTHTVPTPRPLADLVLIESNHADAPLCLRLANSLAARIAADLGARVVKLEPADGDPVRQCGPWVEQPGRPRTSALFEFLNAGKAILRLPPDADTALDTLLSGRVDGVFAEDGDPLLAHARARQIPTVTLTGLPASTMAVDPSRAAGKTAAPIAPLTEFGVLALSAMLDMIGDPEREPLRLGGHQPAYAAGMSAFTAMLALLEGRAAGRPADHAQVSLVETMMWVNWKAVSGAQATGRAPTRRGAKAEFQVFPCVDGHIALVFTVTQYDALVRLIGDPALNEPRFATRAARAEHGEAFIATLAPWFAQRRREDIYQEAQALGVPLGPVFDAHDLLNDPQHIARDFVTTLSHPTLGRLRMPRLPVLWGDRGFTPQVARQIDLKTARDLAVAIKPPEVA